jgi:putative NIF3 family GTP cyclohydrolase 1 type 2
MTVAQLYEILEKSAPRALSAEWDNDGFACLPDPAREVKRVLVALDATESTVDLAPRADLIYC